MRPDPRNDDTVRITRPARKTAANRRGPLWLAGAAGATVAAGLVTWMLRAGMPWLPAPRHSVAPATAENVVLRDDHIRTATEQQIRDHVGPGLTVFRFAADPRIVVLDFASLRQQGLTLNRVAALVEKAGTPRAQVLTDEALDRAIRASGATAATYYYGHDYGAAALARFFTLADAGQVALNPEEVALRRFLTELGWFQPNAEGALISIPQAGTDARVSYAVRGAILRHELAHGAYFDDPGYAAYVQRFWEESLTSAEREAIRRFLVDEGYDRNNAGLMQNEMQAYLMFTRDPEMFTPRAVGMAPEHLAALRAAFRQNLPVDWLRDMIDAPVPAGPAR